VSAEDVKRLRLLRWAAGQWKGEWTTRRVQHLYQARFGPGDWRRTARGDLDQLARQGLLIEHGPENQRHFTHNRDPIAAIIGTGFHMWMAEKFEARQAPLPDGRPRYRIEERVTVRDGYTPAATVAGSSDLFDRLALLNNDWKLVGKSSHDKYRRQGPGDKYRVQAHLYGLGQENAGNPPARVAVTFIARHHELMVHVWSEAYDRQVALDALARLDRIRDRAQSLELDLHPERWDTVPTPDKPTCRFCPWLKPGSTALTDGCPGVQNSNPGSSLNALIA